MDTKILLPHNQVEVLKTVALGHFSPAVFRKVSISLLFHVLRSTNPSLASSKVMVGRLRIAATSFSILGAESGLNIFRTLSPDSVRRAQSLCLERYSSLYCARFTGVGKRVNSVLMTSADVRDNPLIFSSRASLNRMVCS